MTRYGKETFRNVGPVCAEYAESVSISIPGENPDHGEYLDTSLTPKALAACLATRSCNRNIDPASICGILQSLRLQ
jgi:hypothetical protein